MLTLRAAIDPRTPRYECGDHCESIWAGLTNAIIIVRVAGFMLELKKEAATALLRCQR